MNQHHSQAGRWIYCRATNHPGGLGIVGGGGWWGAGNKGVVGKTIEIQQTGY